MEKTKDIHKRIYAFVIDVLKFLKQLPNNPQNNIIINQITRSVTSVGANDQEADGVTTRNDFIHKYSIVRKEAKETEYWLHIIADTNPNLIIEPLLQENLEIIKIVTAIIYKTKNKRDN